MSAHPSQNMRALEYANTVRLGHASVRREIREGALTVAAALDDPRARSMRLFDVLIAQRRWGLSRSDRLLRRVLIGPRRTIEALTSRQRQLLRDELPNA